MAPRKRNYINNPDLYEELTKYYNDKVAGKDPVISNYIGQSLLLITKNMLKRPNFSGYSEQWKQEMSSDALRNSVIGVSTFKPEKSKNPFGFFSRIIWNAFIHRIKLEKKQTAIKHKNHQNMVFMDGNDIVNNDISNQIIDSFEKSMNAAKEKTLTSKNKSDTMKTTKVAAKVKKLK